ncbi:MAG: 2TM domain-containing protein [Dehalogenimonas sp.]
MVQELSEKEIYEQAVKHVKEKKDFFVHLLTYIVVNTAILLIWMMSGAGYPWFIWPLFGWGIGLTFHFLSVWVFDRQTDWERREIDREIARMKNK